MSKKVAYVTGGMGGIGTAICQRLHKEGFKVIAGCGPTRDFNKWLDEQKALGYTFYASVGNVGDWDSTVEAFTKAKAEHGPIDVLVNNAGITKDRMFLKMSKEDWDAVIDTNLKTLFFLSQAAAKGMISQGSGKIINIASMLTFQGGIRVPSYTASKSGVGGLTKAMANEWAAKGINVNAIAPGYIETNNTAALQADENRNRQIVERIPAGRWGKAEDIGGAAVFLASSAADYVNGHILAVDGGWLAR